MTSVSHAFVGVHRPQQRPTLKLHEAAPPMFGTHANFEYYYVLLDHPFVNTEGLKE